MGREKFSKKLMSWLLAVAMVITLVPVVPVKADGCFKLDIEGAPKSVTEANNRIIWDNGQAEIWVDGTKLTCDEYVDDSGYEGGTIKYTATIPKTANCVEIRLYPDEDYSANLSVYKADSTNAATSEEKTVSLARETTYMSFKANNTTTGSGDGDFDFSELEKLVFWPSFTENSGGGGDNPPEPIVDSSVNVKLGDTYLIQNDVVVEGASISGITASMNDKKEVTVELNDCNKTNKDLVITGNSITVESVGTNSFKSIKFNKNVRAEFRPGESNHEPTENAPATIINLAQGISCNDTDGRIGSIGLRDDVGIYIGTSSSKATYGYKDVKKVELYNYDFHERNRDNNKIYATTAFYNVDLVQVYYTKLYVDATKLAYSPLSGDVLICDIEVFQEGQISWNNTIDLGLGQISLRYYDSYPDNTKPYDGNTVNAGILEQGVYVKCSPIARNDLYQGVNKDKFHYEINNVNYRFTLTSTDPILYSVMNKADDGAVLDNGKTVTNPDNG
ncbi:MAG: hypothetical protein IKQ71_03800 [Lachnospiraceae bacterium]|nr:hypothetical protein [Lachnospiraceae bacterium]